MFAGASPAAADSPARYFSVPSAAFTNQLGNFPAVADCSSVIGPLPTSNSQPPVPPTPVSQPTPVRVDGGCPAGDTGTNAFAYNNPAAQPGLGVPLGGVGAGSFMINQAGSFGPWDFAGANENAGGATTQYENRILPQAAFHVREQIGSGAPSVRTLAVNAAPWNQLPSAWSPLKAGDGDYHALWPFGWTSYKPFAAGVSMRFWSPIVAGNDELTSMPVAFFDVRLANTTNQTDKLSVMFTMPNAPEHASGTTRTGLSSGVQTDSATGVTGVTLSSSSPQDTPDAQNSDWTIAAMPASGETVSYVPSWNGSGDGSDIYNAFSATGDLPNTSLDQSSSAGAISVSVTLAPGQVATIPFALAWDFPQVTSTESVWGSSSQYFMRRYTSYFGAQETATNDYVAGSYPFHQGFAIADRLLSEHDSALSQVQGWWDRIVNSPAYPRWLVRQALNEEIQMVFNESFWESGLVTDTPSSTLRIGAEVPNTHLFCTVTGGDWNGCNEWDTDAAGYLAEMLLWPDLERDRLRACVQETLQNIDGVCETGATRNSVTNMLEPMSGRLQFSDIPMDSIYRMYAYYRRTGDTEFLKYAYPAMLKLMQTVQAGIHAPDHLPLDLPGQEDTYDALHAEGHNIYNSELWLLTEEVMIDATQKARDLGVSQASSTTEQQLQSDLPQAKQEFETLFWDPVVAHYKIDPTGQYADGYFVATFNAQSVASTLGLPPLVPLGHEVQHLLAAYPQEMQQKVDGHLVGPPNVVPNSGPVTTTMQPIEENEIWPGFAMQYAGTFLQAAQAAHNSVLRAEGFQLAHALEYWLTEKVSQGLMFDQPDAWEWDAPSLYRSPSMNRTRSTLGVLNTISPIVTWAIPAPPASEYR
jgi:uncharacterized protein (DUF608 family)